MGAARLVVQLLDDDLVVHEYSRSTAQPSAAGVQRMLDNALGWMQAYRGAVDDNRWRADVERAREAQQT